MENKNTLNTQGGSDDLNDVIRLNSMKMYNKHKKKYLQLKKLVRYLNFTVIIFSFMTSIVSVGIQPYLEQKTISGITCLLGILCSIIGSLEMFFDITKQMENNLLASKEYYLLSDNIFKIKSFVKDNKLIKSIDLFQDSYNKYSKLIESSNILPNNVNSKLLSLENFPFFREKSKTNNNSSNDIEKNIENIVLGKYPDEKLDVEKKTNEKNDIENNINGKNDEKFDSNNALTKYITYSFNNLKDNKEYNDNISDDDGDDSDDSNSDSDTDTDVDTQPHTNNQSKNEKKYEKDIMAEYMMNYSVYKDNGNIVSCRL